MSGGRVQTRFACLVHILVLLLVSTTSVDAFTPSTAPAEAEALKSVFRKWGLSSQIKWNTTKDPCSGAALGNYTGSSGVYFTFTVPSIQCDCTNNNGTTCHITALTIFKLDVVGEIPDELWNLTFLISLILSYNYLTGSISPSIGNLAKIQYLRSIENNALSGNLPAELGQLTELKGLSFGTNNFSGPLPSQLGNRIGLQYLYMSSSGVSGEIPASFANQVNLGTLDTSDNELNGSIPEFIGTWTQISTLRLEGNSFAGSIPSSFSNLTALTDVRIGDLPNGKSSLAFITSLTSLNVLRLRNISFLDSIPSGIGKLTNLMYLDLSFNNINGTIPDALFSIGSLSYLYLGNNTLKGSLPQNKTSSLRNIDVSYNQLSGTLPSWVYNQNLQLNLVANNFVGTSDRALPQGLFCLQNNFPCFRGSPRYTALQLSVVVQRSYLLIEPYMNKKTRPLVQLLITLKKIIDGLSVMQDMLCLAPMLLHT